MKSRTFRIRNHFHKHSLGYTLIELLIVLTIGLLLTNLALTSVASLTDSGNFSSSISTVAETLNKARALAMAQNSFVFVGIGEVDGSVPTTAPQVNGIGRVIVSVVLSADGSPIYDPVSQTGWLANTTTLVQINKPMLLDNMHLALVGNTSGNLARPVADALIPTTLPTPFPFNYPLNTGSSHYSFASSPATVIKFSPQGGATLSLSANPRYIEIGLFQSHGNAVTAVNQAKYAAIQIDGSTGALNIFRP